MPALTFDDLTPGGETIGPNGVPRVRIGGTASSGGGVLTFDDLTPESTAAKVGRYAKDIGSSVVSGLDKGVASLAGLPADAALFVGDLYDKGQAKVQNRSVQDVAAENERNALISRKTIEGFTGRAAHENSPLRYDPQTTAGKYAQSAAEFVPSALLGPGNMARNAIALGVAPGLASEAAGQATEGTAYEPYARAGAAVAGGLAGHWATAPNAAQAAVGRASKGVSQVQADAAEQLFQQAQDAGLPITRAEAIQHVTGGATDLGNLQRVVEGSGEMRPFFAQRPQQVEQAARREFDAITPPTSQPQSIGPAAGRAAEGEINDVRGMINTASEPYYKSAENVLLGPQEMAQVRALPGYPEASQAVRKDPQLARYVAGLPENSVGFLNEVKKYLDQAGTNAANGVTGRQNMQRSAGYGSDAGAVKAAAVKASPDYDTALAIQQGGREQILEPLLNGPLGKIADRDIGTRKAIDALFPTNPLPNSQQEIGNAVASLAARNPWAARQLVRAHAETVFNEATQRLQSGANEFGGAGFAAVLRGNPQQAANLEASIKALPNGAKTYEGFDKFLNILEAQGTRQRIGSQTAFNQEIQQGLRQGGTVAEALTAVGTGGLKLPSKIAQRVEQWRMGGNVREIADILTSKEGGDLFRQLVTAPPASAKAAAIVSRIAYLGSRGKENSK